MKAARIILLYAVAVVLVSTLLAPWVFRAVQHGGAYLARQPFHRVYDRILLIVAAAGLWPLLRALGVRHWKDIGWVCSPRGWPGLARGLGLGAGSLGLVALLLLLVGGWHWRGDLSGAALIGGSVKFALSALAVGLLEETFFRGGIQSALARGLDVRWAVPVTSVVYSMVHFLKAPAVEIQVATVTWASGFVHLARVLGDLPRIPDVAQGFVTLWLAGMILGWAFVWTRALYLSIGIHAGWVFVLKLFSWASVAPGPSTAWWIGGSLVGSPVAWPVLLALLAQVWWICRRKTLPLN